MFGHLNSSWCSIEYISSKCCSYMLCSRVITVHVKHSTFKRFWQLMERKSCDNIQLDIFIWWWHVMLSFPGFKDCIQVKWWHFLHSPDCSTYSNTCLFGGEKNHDIWFCRPVQTFLKCFWKDFKVSGYMYRYMAPKYCDVILTFYFNLITSQTLSVLCNLLEIRWIMLSTPN